ncbi:MAG: PAS domain S-box protein [Magnetococcales bacterium]|nr:PAS domain S-box protein [Magnetococcales bacterium]
MSSGPTGKAGNSAPSPLAISGFAFRREDETLSMANTALQAMLAAWPTPDHWWSLVRRRITLPAPTQCPVCGLAQRLGSMETSLSLPEGEQFFDITFSGHAHGLTGPEAGDMLLIRDVTLEKKRLADTSREIDLYRSLCDSIEDVYYRLNPGGIIQFISPSCHKLLYFRTKELIGTYLRDLCVDPDYWSELLEILENSDSVEDFDLVLRCAKGNQVPVSLNARLVFDAKGQRIAIEGILRNIAEREQLDTILAERTRQLQEAMVKLENQKFALDQHAIVSITDANGKIIYINGKMVQISQYTRDEMLGKEFRILDSGHHPKSFFKEMWRTLNSGRVWRGEIRNRKKDGSFFWVDCSIIPIMTPSGKPYQFISIGTDISSRIQAEERLEANRSFLLNISDAMGEGIYVLDLQGRLTFMNREAERLLGWREDELLGRNLHDAIHYKKVDGTLVAPEECPVHRSLLGRAFRVDEDHFIHKDETLVPVSHVTAPLLDGRDIIGSVAIFQEITQRLQADKELKQERDTALEASRMKSEFLANMSHEIRTPMNAIVGMNDLLMDTPLNEEQYEFAEIVRDSSQSLLSLINDILDFSKIEAGKVDIEVIDFTPVTVVEGAAELLAAQAQEKGLSLMTFISPKIPNVLRGDPGRLRQMLLNLISNAIKFTEEGEIVVRALIENEIDGRINVLFSVADTGIGLPNKAHQWLFKPFSQAGGDTSRKYGGTGLGLAISKRLTELMGGEIGAESQAGEGTTFWFRVPFDPSRLPSEIDKLAARTKHLKNRRVLLIMEQSTDKEIIKSYLDGWGLNCTGAIGLEAGKEAIDQSFKKNTPFDLVVTSTALPEIEFLALPKEMEKAYPEADLHWATLQDMDDRELRESVLEAGYHTSIAKPLRQSELSAALLTTLDPNWSEPQQDAILPAPQKEPSVKDPDAYEALESGKLLLLAEDNPVNQRVSLMQLKKLGYAVHAVNNGKEAVEAISHLPYALILMDCQMPVMDGFEATHAIRKQDHTSSRHIPIIAMTANAMKGDRERCLKAGMDDYLSKPVAPDDLKKKLNYWIPKGAAEPPPIELHQLRQLFGNDDEVIRELLRHFLPAAQELLNKLQAAANEKNQGTVLDLIQELKGACSNMGASAMVQLARRLERSIKEENGWEEVANALQALDRAHRRVGTFVENY